MSKKDSMYTYTVEGSKPGKCESFYNSQNHFVLMNIPLTEDGTIDMDLSLEEFEKFLEEMNEDMTEAANEINNDHAKANMDADVSADQNMLGE